MKHLFDRSNAQEILARLDTLTEGAQRQWGKMDVNQMLAHCNASIETALGQNAPGRIFIGRIIGPLVKRRFLSEIPFDKNSPTDKSYIISDPQTFETEKTKARELIHKFVELGPARLSPNPHPFFGPLTPEEWAILQWKHFDHHLQQFGA